MSVKCDESGSLQPQTLVVTHTHTHTHTHTQVAKVIRENNFSSSNERTDGHLVTADFLFQELTKAHSNRQDEAARERGRVMLAEAHAECQVQVLLMCS